MNGSTLGGTLHAGGTWALRVTVSLPIEAANYTMADTVSFGVRLTAEATGASSMVSSPEQHLGAASGGQPTDGGAQTVSAPDGGKPGALAVGPDVELPMTGASISLSMLLVDAGLLLVGGVLLAWSRPRLFPRHLRSSA